VIQHIHVHTHTHTHTHTHNFHSTVKSLFLRHFVSWQVCSTNTFLVLILILLISLRKKLMIYQLLEHLGCNKNCAVYFNCFQCFVNVFIFNFFITSTLKLRFLSHHSFHRQNGSFGTPYFSLWCQMRELLLYVSGIKICFLISEWLRYWKGWTVSDVQKLPLHLNIILRRN